MKNVDTRQLKFVRIGDQNGHISLTETPFHGYVLELDNREFGGLYEGRLRDLVKLITELEL